MMLAAPAVPAQVELFTRLNVADQGLEASVQLGSEDVGHGLDVRCSAACRGFKAFHEDVPESPISLYIPSDADDLLYTTWGGGSAYRVKVYAISAAGVRRVLDEGSLGLPDFLTDAAGRRVVRTTWRSKRAGPSTRPKHADWTWTGARFIRR